MPNDNIIKPCDNTKDDRCNDFQLTKTKSKDDIFAENVIEENLNIGGADLNVFKLLGVHEQGLLVDLAKNGTAISEGDEAGFEAINAFDSFVTEWHSLQLGSAVVQDAFIGYDFGELLLDNNRVQYGIETFLKHNIATIKIMQSANAVNRITKARIERSTDGIVWMGVAIIELPDDDALNIINFKHTVPSRFWRIRPLEFNGTTTDFWAVQAIQLMDYDATSIDDIQDDIFMENRDRDYASESIRLKGAYDLLDTQTELSRFGFEIPSQQFYIQLSFNACVRYLGRPLVIGDVIEIPSEVQYSATMEPIKKYVEVTDVGWSTEGYTPGWTPTMLRIVTQPMMASQETQDIFGGLGGSIDDSGLFNVDAGDNPIFEDLADVSESIAAEADTAVPERGREADTVVEQFTEEQIDKGHDAGIHIEKYGVNPKALYVEDAMPPNGAEFTESDVLPTTTVNALYHRLTYSGLSKDIPARLFRYSAAKGRWIYLETDRRSQYNATKPKLQEFISSPTSVPTSKVTK